MKVLVAGASGFVGGHLLECLRLGGHEVTTLGRGGGSDFGWSPAEVDEAVGAADAVVNLAGANLFAGRWTATRKRELLRSRTETTQRLAVACGRAGAGALVNASAVGYYGASEQVGLTEDAPAGDDFLADVCRQWEESTSAAVEAGVRTCIVRIGVVLGADGGALQTMLPIFRKGLGGPLGHGRQWFPWIHVDDLVMAFRFLVEHEEARGAFNAVSPNPVTNKTFTRALGKVLRRPALFPAPGFGLKLALGEVADVLLTGQNVAPKALQDAGFRFRNAQLEPALRSLLS
jgi:uncharacterized protein (TIGR01777 family)